MSDFCFGLIRKVLRASEARKIDRIAKRHGARFHSDTIPGNGPQSWFTGPNQGHPFDKALREQVLTSVREAGIDHWNEEG